MGMTVTEKILARAAGLSRVEPGQFIEVRVDAMIGHDGTYRAFEIMEREGFGSVFDPDRIYLAMDHYISSSAHTAALNIATMRDYVGRYGITHFFDVGRGGICHVVFPEQGLVLPGELILGGDSHTCTYGALGCFSTGIGHTDQAAVLATGKTWLMVPETRAIVLRGQPPAFVSGKDIALRLLGELGTAGSLYQALEYQGDGLSHLAMEDRFTMANMAVEGGAKNAIMEPDDTTLRWLEGRARRPFEVVRSDPGARYAATLELDLNSLEPQVAAPGSPGNNQPLSAVVGTPVDQCFIGSCTNARIEDLRRAARVLDGRMAHPRTRLIVTPGSQQVYLDALNEGLIQIFAAAGALIAPPGCGACFGNSNGVLGEGEVCISTTNRNVPGRMGHPSSKVYLASPVVVAASALAGCIADPREVAPSCA